MPDNSQPHDDQDLTRLLQAWQVDAHDDPAFAARVWRRIEQAPSPWWQRTVEEVLAVLSRPAGAVATVAVFIMAGIALAGLEEGAVKHERLARLAAEYARSIDPVLMSADMDQPQTP